VATGPRRVIWAPSAFDDLDEVLEHRTDAAELLDEVLNAADSLSTLSERGRLVPELDDAVTRELFIRDFRLIYEVASEYVHVVALVYGARDFETWRRDRERR
jgi:plasmid stabilization system protein ParE